MKLLFLGDVVGDTGRKALYRALEQWRAELMPDLIVANGENAAGGRGITTPLIREFEEHGVHVITLGDHAWDQQDFLFHIDESPHVLRPFNLQDSIPGRGSLVLDTPQGKVGILCLQGRTFMRPGPLNPFTTGYEEALRLRHAGARAILVDFHAETTSEKIAMGYRLDGLVSAVFGTHTHVQTADARILPGGTAYMTDVGMCGSRDGVIGRDATAVLQNVVSDLPGKLPIGGWPAMVSGALVEVNMHTGKADALQPLNLIIEK